jgi:hypothetical protein
MTDLLEELRAVNPVPVGTAVPPAGLRERVLDRADGPRRRRPKPRRVLLGTALAVLVVSGGAAAAVLSLGGEPSEPAAGPIPAATAGQADQYAISVTPDLTLGASGWCIAVTTTAGSERATTGANCGPAPKPGALLAGGGISQLSEDHALVFYVVDQQVAAAELSDGRTVRATSATGLPAGDRLIAATVPVPGTGASEAYLRVRLLGADGQPLTGDADDLRAIYSGARSSATASASRADAACSLTASTTGGIALRDVRAVRSGAPRRVARSALLTCATATARVGDTTLAIGVLTGSSGVNASAPLPGAELVDGIAESSGATSARRLGPAWVVARGGTAHQRREALMQLRATVRP